MKKLVYLLIFLLTFITPLRVLAQNANWVTLQSDTTSITKPGQVVTITLNGSINVPITGAALTLHYDPACFKVASHQAGNLLTGAVAFVQTQTDQLDLTYYFQGGGLAKTGEDSLIVIRVEALKVCTSDISVVPESILLGVLDSKGIASNLPGVELRTSSLHMMPGQAPVGTKMAVFTPLAQEKNMQTSSDSDNTLLSFVSLLLIVLIPIGGLVIYFVANRSPKQTGTTSSVFGTLPGNKTPALIYAGKTMPLSQKGTTLGRHTRIFKRDGFFYLRDTGSLHGTFLNGHPLSHDDYLLRDGDDIQLGREVSYRFVESSGQTAKSLNLKWLKQR